MPGRRLEAHRGELGVLFTTTYQLVQQLLVARRDLSLPRALRALDAYDVMILDDLGYVQQTPDETEVLFTLMAERYERRSLRYVSTNYQDHQRQLPGPPTTTTRTANDNYQDHQRQLPGPPTTTTRTTNDNYQDHRRQLPPSAIRTTPYDLPG
jgi:IstB-like ATP binding protein